MADKVFRSLMWMTLQQPVYCFKAAWALNDFEEDVDICLMPHTMH
jgi:hypothetical protein